MANSDMEISLKVDSENVTIPRALYDHLIRQAWRMEFLTESIRREIEDDERPSYRDAVDVRLVKRLTGMEDYENEWKRRKEAKRKRAAAAALEEDDGK